MTDVAIFEEFVTFARQRVESTSGQLERVFHLALPNGRQVLLRDRRLPNRSFWVVAEVPADASTAAVLDDQDVAAELRRIAARPAREPARLIFSPTPKPFGS